MRIVCVLLTAPQAASSVWSKIDPEYWGEYELNHLSTVDRFDDRDHTWEEAFKGAIGKRYWGLRVSMDVVKELWQSKPEKSANRDVGEGGRSAQQPECIALQNAAAELYSEFRRRLHKRMPNQSWNEPSKALGKIAQLLIGDGLIPIWGSYPPATQVERIPEDDAKQYAISDDASEMFDHINPTQRYTNIQIAKADFERRRAELRAEYGGEG